MSARRRLAALRKAASRGGDSEFALAPSSNTLRSLARNAALVMQLRPVIRRARRLEHQREYGIESRAAKHALPWAKQQKPAKSKPPQPWVEKPWCQGCDRYHVEGKHGPKRAK